MYIKEGVWYVCDTKERELDLMEDISRCYPDTRWIIGFKDIKGDRSGLSHRQIIDLYRQTEDSEPYKRTCLRVNGSKGFSVNRTLYELIDEGASREPYVRRNIVSVGVGNYIFNTYGFQAAIEYAAYSGLPVKVNYEDLYEVTAKGISRIGNYEEIYKLVAKYVNDKVDFQFKKIAD